VHFSVSIIGRMEAVIFDGKEYIKASVLAARFRYTADYLGQLCRGKKVDARLVGRAWYINLDSLMEHKGGRYKNLQVKEKAGKVAAKVSITTAAVATKPEQPTEDQKRVMVTPVLKKPSSNYLSRIDVEPVLKNKTVKIVRSDGGVLSETSVRYEKDDYSLIPRINRAAVSTEIPILPAEAEKLKIHKEPKKFTVTDFKAEELPEVFLAGRVKVDGLPEAAEEANLEALEKESETSDITSKIKPVSDILQVKSRLVSLRKPLRVSELQSEKREVTNRIAPNRVPVIVKKPIPAVPISQLNRRLSISSSKGPVPPQMAQKNVESVLVQPKNPSLAVVKQPNPTVLPPKTTKSPVNVPSKPQARPRMPEKPAQPRSFSPTTVLQEKEKRVPSAAEHHFGWGKFFSVLTVALVIAAASILTVSEVRVDRGFYSDTLIIDLSNVASFSTFFDGSFIHSLLEGF
jgi:hypothetical protein